jgi:hypothetical protein
MKYLKYLKCLCVVALGLSGGYANAQTASATGTVQSIRTYGDGRVLVTGFSFPGATCNNGSFWIPGDHPKLSAFLASLLSAKAMGLTITVVAKIDNCWFPEITNDSTTLIIVNE